MTVGTLPVRERTAGQAQAHAASTVSVFILCQILEPTYNAIMIIDHDALNRNTAKLTPREYIKYFMK